ncbi:MAG: AlpA family phage regulatory protein [Burkholderiales bacterium]|nr:AlpA family phage regulatory protein [Burkholderiales bacterium]
MQQATSTRPARKPAPSFDDLPDAANVRLPAVRALLDCSAATVWRWSGDGRMPAARRLGANLTVWNVGELRRWLASKAGA